MRLLALAAAFASLAVGSSMAPGPPSVPAGTGPVGEESAQPYLRGLDRLAPDRFPTAEEVASGCYSATAAAIGELESAGAIVDPTYEEYRVRKLACRWAADDPGIAECRFEKASVPGLLGGEPAGADPGSHLRDRDWKPAAARFALVRRSRPLEPVGAPYWVAADTCEPFVFKAGEWEIDLRAMARRRLQARKGAP
jgi:hypothetical protein